MKEKIYNDIIDAMKNKDKDRLEVLRMVKGAIQLEEIKAKNQLKWVGLMNNIKAQAEEFVLRDFVYSMEGRR